MKVLILNFWGDSQRVGGKRWKRFGESLEHDKFDVLTYCYSNIIPSRRTILKRRILRLLGLNFLLFKESYEKCLNDLKTININEVKTIIISFPPIELLKALVDSDILNQNKNLSLFLDLRDGLLKETLEFPVELFFHKKKIKTIKKTLFSRAKGIIYTNPYLLKLESLDYLEKSHVIYNGFVQKPISSQINNDLINSKFRLGYFGGLTKSTRGQDVTGLLEAIKNSNVGNNVDLVFYGDYSLREHSILRNYKFVKVFSTIPYSEAQIEMQKCDALLLVATVKKRKSLLTGKIWDYLSQNKPIVYYGLEGMAFDLLKENKILITHTDFIEMLEDGRSKFKKAFNLPFSLSLKQQYYNLKDLIN